MSLLSTHGIDSPDELVVFDAVIGVAGRERDLTLRQGRALSGAVAVSRS